jgi:TonB family protein
MKRCVLLFVLGLLSLPGSSQTSDTVVTYFDKDWKEILNPAQAVYFRTIHPNGDRYVVRDYFVSTKAPQMIASCSETTPKLVFDGPSVWYYENGSKKKEGTYEKGDQVGLFKEYFERGTPQSQLYYRKGEKTLHYQHWSQEGEPILVNGTGTVSTPAPERSEISVIEIADSIVVTSYAIRIGKDTVYALVENPAEYNGGLQKLANDLGRLLVYPKDARKKGIEGKVFIAFIVDEKGNVREAEVLRGIGNSCDAAALKAVNELNKWNPGRYKGKAVKTRFVLPVSFKLT